MHPPIPPTALLKRHALDVFSKLLKRLLMNEYSWWAWSLSWRGVASSLAAVAADVWFLMSACLTMLHVWILCSAGLTFTQQHHKVFKH